MSSIPKKENKLFRGLSEFVGSCLDATVTTKENMLTKIGFAHNRQIGR